MLTIENTQDNNGMVLSYQKRYLKQMIVEFVACQMHWIYIAFIYILFVNYLLTDYLVKT